MPYALFETDTGWAGVAWSEAGLFAVHLPELEIANARRGILRKALGAVEADLSPAQADARLDLAATPGFDAKVYQLTCAIPPGVTRT